jgi:hypothetical protein
MHAHSVIAICVFTATAVFASSISPRDGQFGSDMPGLTNNSIWGPNDYPMSYPDPKVLFRWTEKQSPLKITIKTDVVGGSR